MVKRCSFCRPMSSDPPAGIQVVSTRAQFISTSTGAHSGATDNTEVLPVPTLYPVSTVVLTPGHPSTWYLLALVKVTRRGTFFVKGVKVRYRAGGRTGTHSYIDSLLVKTA